MICGKEAGAELNHVATTTGHSPLALEGGGVPPFWPQAISTVDYCLKRVISRERSQG